MPKMPKMLKNLLKIAILIASSTVAVSFAATPTFSSTNTFSVFENTTAVATLSATDENGTAATFSTSITGTNATAFTLTADGVLAFNTAPVFSTTDAAANIYNITISATNAAGTTTQNITINIITKPTFNLTATDITLTENSPETIRHQVDITDIIDRDNSSANARFTVSSAGGIFSANPAPVVSFSNSSIMPTAVLSSTAQTATLYFTIKPNATGAGIITISLTDALDNISSKTVTVSVTQATNSPVITDKFDSRLQNLSVYGGHLYAYSAITESGESNNAYKAINTELGGHFIAINSIEEENFLNSAMSDGSLISAGWEALVSSANVNNNAYPFNLVLETNTGSTLHSVVNSAGNYTIYPGFYDFKSWSTGPVSTGVAHPASEYVYGTALRKISTFLFGEEVSFGVRNSRHEFPNGFAALTQASSAIVRADALNQVATLSGFDLDGDNITWSYSDSVGNGTATFTNNRTKAGISTTTVVYQSASDFAGTTILSIILTDSNNNSTTAVIDITVLNTTLFADSINENAGAGATVGTFSTAGISAAAYTYTLDNTATFSISGDTLIANNSFDFETQSSYTITVTTNDGDGNAFSKDFIIDITDELEKPVITPNIFSVLENTTAVATLSATDENGIATLLTNISGVNAASFTLTAAGVLTFNTAPVYSATDAAANIYNITISATNGIGITTQTITINVITKPTFNITATDITLIENADNTIRHQVDITVVDEDNDGNVSLAVSATGAIFTTNPAPVVSFSDSSIMPTAAVGSTPKTAILYFTIIPDTIGTGTINITLTDENSNITSKTLTVTVTKADNSPPVISKFDGRISNLSVFGGHIYASQIGQGNNTSNLFSQFQPVIDDLDGHFAIANSEEEDAHIGSSNNWQGLVSNKTMTGINNNNDYPFTLLIEGENGTQTHSNMTADGVYTLYPGFYDFNWTPRDGAVQPSNRFSANGQKQRRANQFLLPESNWYDIRNISSDYYSAWTVRGASYEFPNGLAAVATLSATVYQNNSANIKLIGSDLDGDNITWSYDNNNNNDADGTVFINNANSDGIGTTNITYTPATGFVGTTAFTIILTDGNSSATAVVNITVIPYEEFNFVTNTGVSTDTITLIKNSSETIRYKVDINNIVNNDSYPNNGQLYSLYAGYTANIFTSNPSPAISFNDREVDTTEYVSSISTPKTASLYFTIKPNTTGVGTITVTLIRPTTTNTSKKLTVKVINSNSPPVISKYINDYVDEVIDKAVDADTISRKYDYQNDLVMFGGSLYFSLDNANGANFDDFVALQSAFNGDDHLAIIDSWQEQAFIDNLSGGGINTFLGLSSVNGRFWTSVLGDHVLDIDNLTYYGDEHFAPGSYFFSTYNMIDDVPNEFCLSYTSVYNATAYHFNDIPCDNTDVKKGLFELPSGLPALTSTSTTINQDSSFETKFSGFDLDGGNITWSYAGGAINGTVILSNTGGNSIGTASVSYQPEAGFVGTADFDIILTDSNNSSTVNVNIDVINTVISKDNIDENVAAGEVIGTFSTTGVNGVTYAYTLNNTETFSISGDTLISAIAFDRETKASYTINVTTTYNGKSLSKDFTIFINNVYDEIPVITSTNTFNILENTTAVATLSATTENASAFTFSTAIAGADAASFILTADGVLTFVTAPVFSTQNIYNIEVSAVNNIGTATKAITINILTKSEFTLATNAITLIKNSPETIRHKVDITVFDRDNGGGSASFTVSASGIFTTEPAPVVSFSDTSIITTAAAVGSTAQTAALYFTIIPDTLGAGNIEISLTDELGNITTKKLTVTVNQSNTVPIISQDIATYIANAITNTVTAASYNYQNDVTIFGGSLYFSLNNDGGANFADFVALQSAFNTDAHLAIIDSKQEKDHIDTLSGGLFDTYLGVASGTATGFGTVGSVDSWYSALGDFVLFDSAPAASNSGEQIAPGHYDFSVNDSNNSYFADNNAIACLRYQDNGNFNDRPCNDIGGGAVDDGFFELPSGLPAITTLSAIANQNLSSEVAKLSGFDLDGNNITWSYFDVNSHGTATFTNNRIANAGVSNTTVNYQAEAGFAGVTTLIITLTDSDNNITATNIDINVVNTILSADRIYENTATGTFIGVFSTNSVYEGTYTYTLNNTETFSISGNTLTSAITFDYETKASYTISVTTTDEIGNSFAKDFIIYIADDEKEIPAIISTNAFSILENTTLVTTLSATDGADFLTDITGEDSASFALAANGVLTFNTAPVFSTTTAADNIYNIQVKAANATGTDTQAITINVVTKPIFNLSKNAITLTENAANTIRHQININNIRDIDDSNDNASFTVSTTGGIFTTNPAPVVSFSDTSINSTAIIVSTPQIATLYFTVIPDTAGTGTINITLTDENSNITTKTLTVTVTKADNPPVIISEFDSRLFNLLVFGGHIYANSAFGDSTNNSAVSAFQPVIDDLGGHFASANSEQENAIIGSDYNWQGLVSDKIMTGDGNYDIDYPFTLLIEGENGTQTHSNITADGVYTIYPGFYDFSWSANGQQPSDYFSKIGERLRRSDQYLLQENNLFGNRRASYEFSTGFAALTTTLNTTISQGLYYEIAKLSGFDLDGDNITWSYTDSDSNGTTIFDTATNTGVSITTVHYQAEPGFTGSTTLSIILTDENNNSATVNVNISVVTAPDISLSATTVTAYVGIAIADITVINHDGDPAFYAISPAISNGLSFSTTTGTISGAPTYSTDGHIIEYTITATNIRGTDSATLSIIISPTAPSIAISPAAFTAVVKTPISGIAITNSAGQELVFCDSNPALPAGISIAVSADKSTCEFSGTPSATQDAQTYTITALNITAISTDTISITVNPEAPNIILSEHNINAELDMAITNVTVISFGGTPTSYTIAPPLDNGLSFDVADGTISGTPSATHTARVWTVTATNITASDSAIIEISVSKILNPPNIANIEEPQTYYAGTMISPIEFTNSGDPAQICYGANLPYGLIVGLSGAHCVISGTAIVISPATTYTITAINSQGSDTATINISVTFAIPSISLSTTTVVASVATAITAITVSNDGGTSTYSISPTLSEGLSFATNTGTISGTPSATATLQIYTITANNVTGTNSATISITVNPQAPIIAFSPATITAIVGIYIDISATNTGGVADLYSIAPAIANNLSFSTATGAISGTPTNVATNVVWTITASNVSGISTATLSITVNPVAPDISLSTTAVVASIATAITAITVSNNGGAATYSISPTLSEGLSFATTTGTISGTPSATATLQVYTITASNVTNSDSATLSITVNIEAPNISISTTTITAVVGIAITDITVSNDGGTATYSISPALSEGLSFNTETGTVSGTPSTPAKLQVYTITASNITSDDSVILIITVNPTAPIIAFLPASITAVVGVYVDISVTNTGGIADLYSIEPEIANGLSFNDATGTISGTPANAAANVVYTVTASNVTGSSTATINITVNPAAPDISLSTTTIVASVATAITAITVSNNGGTATYSISPALSEGLSFATNNGTISGIPSATATLQIYTITASNVTNSDSATLSITVNIAAPNISLSTTTITAVVGIYVDISATNTGGVVDLYSIAPSITNNLSFNAATGSILGTPSASATAIIYTITATNITNSDSATLSITVNAAITFSLDADGNGTINASNDGLIIFKYLLNSNANNLHTTISSNAVKGRKTTPQLKVYLDSAGTILDADGNQTINASNDGLIIFKYLLNSNANNLHTTISSNAIEGRKTTKDLKAYLDKYK